MFEYGGSNKCLWKIIKICSFVCENEIVKWFESWLCECIANSKRAPSPAIYTHSILAHTHVGERRRKKRISEPMADGVCIHSLHFRRCLQWSGMAIYFMEVDAFLASHDSIHTYTFIFEFNHVILWGCCCFFFSDEISVIRTVRILNESNKGGCKWQNIKHKLRTSVICQFYGIKFCIYMTFFFSICFRRKFGLFS